MCIMTFTLHDFNTAQRNRIRRDAVFALGIPSPPKPFRVDANACRLAIMRRVAEIERVALHYEMSGMPVWAEAQRKNAQRLRAQVSA
jgi:hypothetical protein